MAELASSTGPAAPATPRLPRAGHGIFRWAFVPMLLIASVASWVFHDELEQARIAAHWPLDYLTTALILSLGTIWVAEQLYPANVDWNYQLRATGLSGGWQRLGRDLFYLFCVAHFTNLLAREAAPVVTALMTKLGYRVGVSVPFWPAHASFPIRAMLTFFLAELCNYLLHRAAHRFRFLWQFHSTHHVITELGGLKSIRVHPVDNLFFYLARTVPLMVIGVGGKEVFAVSYFTGMLSILAHANIDVSEGFLGYVVNFPRYHQVHHSSAPEDYASNFGCHTVLWDRVFGTFRTSVPGKLEVGVRPVGTRTLWQELAWPFYRGVS